ncbi:MAG: WD40 repeat domain-containing protein [Candidatus Poribacteria bacterium]|nr:WD40 repeat domain-containing protein [Candidatus Poribacteria bacterium]
MNNTRPAELNIIASDPIGNTWGLPEGGIVRFGTGRLNRVELSLCPDVRYLAIGTGVGLWWYDTTSMLPISLWEKERGLIDSVNFSHDGRQIVICNWDRIIKVMDVQTAECIYEMEVQGSNFTLSSNCKWIASSDGQGIVRVYDIQKGKILAQMDRGQHKWKSNDISHLEFSPDGNLLASTAQNQKFWSADDDRVPIPDREGEQTYLWHPETGEVILKLAGRNFVFSADSCLLAGASPDDSDSTSDVKRIDRCVSVWDIKNRERIAHFTEHDDWVQAITFSPCGKFIASCDETLRVWELATGRQKMAHENCYDSFYSPDGVLFGFVFPSDDTIEVWNMDSQQKVLELPQSFNFELVKSKVFTYMREHQFHIADVISNKQANGMQWTLPIEHRISFSMPDPLVEWIDDQTLASGSLRQGIVLWDIVEKRVRERLLDGEYIHIFTVLPDGKMLAALVCSQYDATKIWDVANPEKPIAEFHTNLWWERHQAFSPTGDRMAAGSNDGPVYVWNLQQPEHPMILTGHAKKHIYSLAFSPDGKRLVTGSDDNTARLWDLELGKQITILPMDEHHLPIKVLFSPCGNIIAGGLGNEIRLWCAEQLTTLLTIPQPDNNQRTYALAFSPCSNYLASGTWWEKGMQKMAIRLWDVATGENIHTFCGHNSDVQSLAFSPNGTMLASGGFDGTIMVWDLKPYL